MTEVMISKIEPTEESEKYQGTKIELLEGLVHDLQEDDIMTFKEVVGMDSISQEAENGADSINGKQFKVIHKINKSSFVIECDSRARFTPYERNGIAVKVKQKV